ncbi:hypothetical protein ACTWP5_04420 [Streptomyces sp. 4N509B]|uniref:hypothetical protein n=1 Tax=Streptomyces sp. 4N509B TaxID=3457413 RepID=UPI003FD0E04B
MSAVSVNPMSGATASAAAAGEPNPHARHLWGNALRAARVMAGVVFEVVVLGRVEEERVHDRRPVRSPSDRHPA